MNWCTLCWQSRSRDVTELLAIELRRLKIDPESQVEEGRHESLHTAYRYLKNNESRMDYESYRKAGHPVTSAPMESLVKEIHLRVKGPELFWNASQRGGECILQLRSSYLCEDNRLRHYLSRRPGHPFVRRSTKAPASTPKC